MNWGECYYNHYEKYLRQPVDRKIFRQNSNSPSLQILAYDQVFTDCRVFCSLGMTHYVSKLQKHAEVILVVDDGWEDVPYLFANALFFMIQSSMNLGWGIAISGVKNINPEFVQRYQKTALYFSMPYAFPKEFNDVFCNQERGFFFMAGFISENEYKFFVEHGAGQFEELLERENVDLLSVARDSCM